MVDKEKITFCKALYYTPGYGSPTKISILRLKDDGRAIVKQFSRKGKDFKPFPVPLVHIYDNNKDAVIGTRAWESYVRKRKREEKERRKAKKGLKDGCSG